MFFNNPEKIESIASKNGCTIFVMPNKIEIPIKNSLMVCPGEIKTGIVIEQIQNILEHINSKQKTAQYITVKEADKMNLAAANAFLKSLEEPKENYHFILQTENISNILPTILSRSAIYVLKKENPLDSEIDADAKIKDFAKRLIVAKNHDYVSIMNDITKKKDNTREYALNILQVAIEISYKSFFKTNNQVFLKKIPNFIKAYENISANGHIKLHLVADML